MPSDHVYERHTPYSLSDWQFYLSRPEIDLLTDLTMRLPDRPVVVNVGAGAGTSGLTFLSARPDLFLYTVDVQLEITLYGGLENEQGILRAAGLLDFNRYQPIHGDSKAVGRAWANGPVDLVFVDGDHTRAGAEGDVDAWWPHLRAGGVMVVHDYYKLRNYLNHYPIPPTEAITPELLANDIKPYPDVDAVVDELLAGKLPGKRAAHIATADTAIAVRKEPL